MLKENEIHDGREGKEESKARKNSIPVTSLISMWEVRATTLKKNTVGAISIDATGKVLEVIFFAFATKLYYKIGNHRYKSCSI